MPEIKLTTFIAAPVERVFDLSRSVSLVKQALLANDIIITGEKTTGLLREGESVTLESKLFFKKRVWKLQITKIVKPEMYIEEQAEGFLKSFTHIRYFKPCENGSFLIDQVSYDLKQGIAGEVADKMVFRNYLSRVIEIKNASIKQAAESNRWKQYIDQ
jgi:ligand-binding SRPBCC domain-containing protein